jgi:opacity protein-like surface antigen
MKLRSLLVIAAAAALLSSGSALAEMKGEVNLFLGMKDVKDSDFENVPVFKDQTLDVSSMTEYGVGASFGGVDWPVMIAVDVLMGSDDDSATGDYGYDYRYKIELDTTEVHLGVRKFWTNHEKFHPYVGGGLAWIDAEAKLSLYGEEIIFTRQPTELLFEECYDDSGTGFWLGGGVMWRFTPRLSLGLDLRYSDASVDFEVQDDIDDRQVETVAESFDVGGMHYGLQFGFRW